jgi:DHA1 family bicyclomycin/chloramphenicol resistance-like MFS transporter
MESAPAYRAPRGLVVLLATVSMIGPFTIDTIFPAFPALEADLRSSPVAVQQTISVYMLTFAVASLVHGPLSDALGRKKVIVFGMAAYALASAVCAIAPNLPVLLFGRVLQGLVAGAGLVVSRTVARDLFPPNQAQRALATMGMIFGVAPAIAPIVGGWLLTWTSWRGIFWFLAAYGVVVGAAVVVSLPESHPAAARTPLRLRPLATAVVQALRDPAVLRISLAIAAGFGAMFLYISSAPAFVVGLLGLGAQDYWVLFVPLVSMLVFGSWIVGRLSGRVPRRQLIWAGLAVAGAGGILQILVTGPFGVHTTPWVVVGPALTSLGVSVVFPVATVALLDLRPRHRGTVSSLQAAIANGSNAAVSGLLSPLVSHSFICLALAGLTLTGVSAALWLLQARAMARHTPVVV